MTDAPKRGRGRPPKAPDEQRRHRVPVRLTDAELEVIDRARGETDRATYMVESAMRRASRVR